MTFERTRDMELVGAIVRHPQIYGPMVDDFAPPRDQFEPVDHDGIWYMLVRDGDRILGLFALTRNSEVLWEVHTCLLPSARGASAIQAGRELIAWVWSNTPCQRFITNVPAYNRLALRLAKKCGMVEFGVNPKSFKKNGQLWDQVMLGVSREN